MLLELMDAEGRPTGLTSTIQIPPFGEFAKFIREIPGFGGIPSPFRGVLRITASTPESINVVGIRGRINERSDFIMTSVLPFAAENSATETVVPQVVEGGVYSTEVVLFNGRTGTVSSGNLDLVSGSASPSTLSTN